MNAPSDKPSCDFIGRWLEFWLRAYRHLIVQRPEHFAERRIAVEGVPA